MDLFNKFQDLVKESLLCKSYKGMSVITRILCIIAIAPVIAVYVGMLLVYWLLAVIYRFSCNIADYIHAFVAKERGEVRHATEAVVYVVAFPWIFAMKLISGVFAFLIMIAHFFTSMVGYVATFGGIKFSPFVLDDVDRFDNRDAVKHKTAGLIIFMVISLVLLFMASSFALIAYAIVGDWVKNVVHTVENLDKAAFKEIVSSMHSSVAIIDNVSKAAYALFVAIYVSVYGNCVKKNKYIYQT